MKELEGVNIRHIKLSSGDEIIALVNSIKKDGIILVERPLLIQSFTNPHTNAERFYFMDYMPVSRKSLIHISVHNVIAHCEVVDNVKEAYIRYCTTTELATNVETGVDSGLDDELFEELASLDKSKMH